MLPEGSVCIISKRDLKSVSYNRKRITEWLWWSSSEKSRVTPVWVDTKIHKEPMLLAPKTLESNPTPDSSSKSPWVSPGSSCFLTASAVVCATVLGTNIGIPLVWIQIALIISHRSLIISQLFLSMSRETPGVTLPQNPRLTSDRAGSGNGEGAWPGVSCCSYLTWLLR